MATDWRTTAESLACRSASHYELANLAERLGFVVIIDPDDCERSILLLDEQEIGQIVGDDDAVVTIWDDEDPGYREPVPDLYPG